MCQDCHGVHRVVSPDSAGSRVHPANLAGTCGQQACHRGATLRFAMSGANHLGLRARRDRALAAIETGFAWGSVGVMALLAAGVAFDLGRRLRVRARLAGAPRPPHAADLVLVPRVSRAVRLQHGALALAFTALALTGLPLRFPDAAWLAGVVRLAGGLDGARLAHRVAAALMAATALAHLAHAAVLLARARGDVRRAWPLLPGRADLAAWADTVRFHLGRRGLPGAGDRHDFRQRLHYLAVAWGVPVMTLSGLVLAFPVALGGRLPDLAIATAMIAHSDEALLAIGVVVVWHLYAVHVAPGAHHRFATWWDGRVTRGLARMDHPLDPRNAADGPVGDAERRALIEQAWPLPARLDRRGRRAGAAAAARDAAGAD
jgi:cytochrome b subunit of formate dehydrogenase